MALVRYLVLMIFVTTSRGIRHWSIEDQKFATEPSDQTAILGSTVVLPCRIINQIAGAQWTRDGLGLGMRRHLRGFDRYEMIGSDDEGDFSLKIAEVTMEDDALYECQASLPIEPPLRSKPVRLKVFVPPKPPELEPSPNVHATAGVPVTVKCTSNEGRPAPEFQWMDGSGSLIYTEIETNIDLMEDGKRFTAESNLTFTPTRHHNSQTLSCIIHSPAITTSLVATVNLHVEYRPVVELTLISSCYWKT